MCGAYGHVHSPLVCSFMCLSLPPDLRSVGGHLLTVILDVTLDLDTEAREVLGILHLTHTARGSKEGLGRNATAVHASAANVTASEDGRLQTLTTSVQSSSVTTNTAANDDDIVVELHGHLGGSIALSLAEGRSEAAASKLSGGAEVEARGSGGWSSSPGHGHGARDGESIGRSCEQQGGVGTAHHAACNPGAVRVE